MILRPKVFIPSQVFKPQAPVKLYTPNTQVTQFIKSANHTHN